MILLLYTHIHLKMKKRFTFLLFSLLIAAAVQLKAQMGVTSYSIYALGINTSQNKKISGELKTFANRSVEDLLFEIDGFYNFEPREYHRFSIGLGINVGPFRGFDHIRAFTLPVALEIHPLQDFKRFSFLFELTPEFIVEDELHLRGLWGLRYTFGE